VRRPGRRRPALVRVRVILRRRGSRTGRPRTLTGVSSAARTLSEASDHVEASHEALRAMTLPGEAAWMTAAMLPMNQLCPGEHGHAFTRGLSLAHLDAVLRGNDAAGRFLADSADNALAARGMQTMQYHPSDLR
jgi:hypothetical protein